MDNKPFSRPVRISLGGTPREVEVASAKQAADLLMGEWPRHRDERHRDAVDACLKVLEGYRSTEDAEHAFREAAATAGILLPD
jgi:hypothetical protein